MPRISTSLSEPWVAWVMAALLVLLLLADSYMRGVIVGSFQRLFATKERDSIFSETIRNSFGQIALALYKAGIIAMMVYIIVYHGGHFGFLTWLLLLLIVVAVGGLKYAAGRLLSYIFLDKDTFPVALSYYSGLITAVTVVLYPVLLVLLFAPFVNYTTIIITLSLAGAFMLAAWCWKAFQLFFTNLFAGFYIFLYLCTLELLPFAGILFLANSFVN